MDDLYLSNYVLFVVNSNGISSNSTQKRHIEKTFEDTKQTLNFEMSADMEGYLGTLDDAGMYTSYWCNLFSAMEWYFCI